MGCNPFQHEDTFGSKVAESVHEVSLDDVAEGLALVADQVLLGGVGGDA